MLSYGSGRGLADDLGSEDAIGEARKALATIGTGPAARQLQISLPTFTRYAARHGYDIIVGSGDSAGRPPVWAKIRLLQRLIRIYDFVLWVDADAVILDPSEDIASVVPEDAFQAYVVATLRHRRGQQVLAGVWALRRDPRASRFLDRVWDQTEFIDHFHAEQAAVMHVTGWTTEMPFVKQRSTEWDEGTFILDETWNMVPYMPIGYAPGKIRHYPRPWTQKRRLFDMRTDTATGVRHLIGEFERRTRHIYRPITAKLKAAKLPRRRV
jgi:hypothetical protein